MFLRYGGITQCGLAAVGCQARDPAAAVVGQVGSSNAKWIQNASGLILPAQTGASKRVIATPGCEVNETKGTTLSGSISTVWTGLSWICVGVHSRRALPCPVCG